MSDELLDRSVKHYRCVRDDGSGASMFSVSTREADPAECERRAREWLRPGYHLEIQEQRWQETRPTWHTLYVEAPSTGQPWFSWASGVADDCGCGKGDDCQEDNYRRG